jgi:hypothetical protein
MIAQRQITRMDADMRVLQPAGRFKIRHTRTQPFSNRFRRHFKLRLEPRHNVMRFHERRHQPMIVIRFRRRFAGAERSRRFQLGIIVEFPHGPKPVFLLLFFGASRHFLPEFLSH